MARVVLHGDLKRFGGPYDLSVKTPAEAVRALGYQIKGFRKRLAQGAFKIVRVIKQKRFDLDKDMLDILLAPEHELHITPVVAGGKGGAGKIVLGIALAATAFVTSGAAVAAWGAAAGVAGTGTAGLMSATAFTVAGMGVSFSTIAGFGLVMAFAGASQMLASTQKSGNSSPTSVDRNESFLFGGPENATTQGTPIPYVYGTYICGSVVGSSDLATENI